MVLGDAVSKLETPVWILNHVSRSITWSLFKRFQVTIPKVKEVSTGSEVFSHTNPLLKTYLEC